MAIYVGDKRYAPYVGNTRRKVMGEKAPDENSYIQDGLVFQLDGINKGSNQGYWTDLKGGVTFTIPTSEYLTEETNGFTWTGNVNMPNSGTMPTGGTCTVEIAMFPRGYLSNNRSSIFASRTGNTQGDIQITRWDNRFVCIAKTKSIAVSSLIDNAFITISFNTLAACVNKNQVQLSGSEYTSQTSTGVGKTASVSGMRGTIHAIRIYNKQLTLAEMQFNQNIDLKRFGT